MKNLKIDGIIRKFLISEGNFDNPSLRSRLSTLQELLNKISGKSLAESRRLEIIREQVFNIKREVRKLEEQNVLLEEENKMLQEKLTLLEENKEG